MDDVAYYRRNLAMVHHLGFGGHADRCAPGVISLLEPYRTGTVLEIGCGSGALTRHLVDSGFDVVATDASPEMLQIAARSALGADYRLLALPNDAIPAADAIVAVGHPFNYLATAEEVRRAIDAAVAAIRPDGLLVTDICNLAYASERQTDTTHADVHDEWAIFTRFSSPDPSTFVREITTFVRGHDGCWDRDDEVHRNVLVDVESIAADLNDRGFETEVQPAFGTETLPAGLVVLLVRKPA